jgi:cobalt/nickel transport system permease protein
MRLESLEDRGDRSRPLHRLDACLKLLFALAFVVFVVAVPIGHWRLLGSLGLLLALLLGLAGASPRALLVRWLGFVTLVSFLAVMIAPGLPATAEYGFGAVLAAILIKNSLAFLMMLLLSEVTTWRDLLAAMRRLGVPMVLVATLQFMERYLHVLGDELGRMLTARRARSFRSGGTLSWTLLTGVIATLLLRSFERAERVHDAMTARGWDGTIRTLED